MRGPKALREAQTVIVQQLCDAPVGVSTAHGPVVPGCLSCLLECACMCFPGGLIASPVTREANCLGALCTRARCCPRLQPASYHLDGTVELCART